MLEVGLRIILWSWGCGSSGVCSGWGWLSGLHFVGVEGEAVEHDGCPVHLLHCFQCCQCLSGSQRFAISFTLQLGECIDSVDTRSTGDTLGLDIEVPSACGADDVEMRWKAGGTFLFRLASTSLLHRTPGTAAGR